jgi:hypothetical protein
MDATEIAHKAMLARGRLSEAKKWFAHRGWEVLPQGIRGQRILGWGADQAYLASPANPNGWVRRWCRRWAPWLKEAELAELVARTVDQQHNKRWSGDECAAVLEITVRDRTAHGFRFIGADDDPTHEIRLGVKREKAAARARKFRAVHRTGAKRGRPALQLSKEDRLARSNAQAAERMKRLRALRKNASRPLIDISSVTEFSVTDMSHDVEDQTADSRSPQAIRRQAPTCEDLDDDGDAFGAPPPTHLVERTLIPF